MRNSGERVRAQESRDFLLTSVSVTATALLPLIVACGSDRGRQPVQKVESNDGLLVEVFWERPSALRGMASVSFGPETFVKLERERSLTLTYKNPVDPDSAFIFSARTISRGVTILASYKNIRVNDIQDYWEKDFYDLNPNIRNTFMTG